jgi:enoyl-CoA hydratase/3-hydroxyacyl-CoA dehydrogenase
VAILGARNVGHGIAEVAALAGYDVSLRDIEEELVRDGYDQIEWSLGKLAERDRIGDDEADAELDRVETFVDPEASLADADVVIEVVSEKMAIKKDVYGEVVEHAPGEAVFVTNTSSLSITERSEVTDRPERFCGMHFFNPPVRMDLVEVISGAHTSEDTLELIEGLADRPEVPEARDARGPHRRRGRPRSRGDGLRPRGEHRRSHGGRHGVHGRRRGRVRREGK